MSLNCPTNDKWVIQGNPNYYSKKPIYFNSKKKPNAKDLAGHAKAIWKKGKDLLQRKDCIICNKKVKAKDTVVDLEVKKAESTNLSGTVLTFSLQIHRGCIIDLLDDCPFEDVEVLKELDLTTL